MQIYHGVIIYYNIIMSYCNHYNNKVISKINDFSDADN